MNPLFRPVAVGIYTLFFLIGIVFALVMPTLSMFLAKEIGVRPLLVGIPYAGIALASMFYNQAIGHWSDRLSDRRPLIAIFCVLGCLVCLFLAWSRNYWMVAATVIFFLSLALVAYSQVLAYSLDYAERSIPQARIPLFNAIVRAQIAIAWVAGPPVGFLIAGTLGFRTMYLLAAMVFLIIALLGIRLLPRLTTHHPVEDVLSLVDEPLNPPQKRALLLSVLGFSLMWAANSAYLIAMPLHLRDAIGVGTQQVGWVMGTCAFLEIPFMLLTGHYARRTNPIALITLAGVCAMLLYTGVYWAQWFWQFFALQVFNAVFIGVLAGLGVSLVQELLPGRSGMASALYTNTTHMGSLLSSLIVATVADVFGYRQIFMVNLFIVLLAILAFSRVRLKQSV